MQLCLNFYGNHFLLSIIINDEALRNENLYGIGHWSLDRIDKNDK